MNNDIIPNKTEESLGYLLWQTNMIWHREMNRALDEVNLTHTQFAIMAAVNALLETNINVTQKDVAAHSKTDTMMVSKILRVLEKKGWVARKNHNTDKRAKCVVLTEAGSVTLRNAYGIVTQANGLFFSDISDVQKFKQELKQIISK